MSKEQWVIRAGTTAAPPFSTCVTPSTAAWTYSGLRILELSAEGVASFATGAEEMLAVPLAGGVELTVDGVDISLAGRVSVFAGHTDTAYLPAGAAVQVHSTGGCRLALATAIATPETGRRAPRYLPVGNVSSALRGAGTVSRQVVDLANADLCPADRLIVCEVYTPAGNTSSAPPHKHDTAGPGETELEEIYYFELSGPGTARHATSASDSRPIDVDTQVSAGDVALVPYGWHGPTRAPASAHLYYLNVMAGPVRAWQVSFHPTAGPRPGPNDDVDPRLPLVGVRD